MVQNPAENHVDMMTDMLTTMADSTGDPTPFTPVTPKKPYNKVKENMITQE